MNLETENQRLERERQDQTSAANAMLEAQTREARAHGYQQRAIRVDRTTPHQSRASSVRNESQAINNPFNTQRLYQIQDEIVGNQESMPAGAATRKHWAELHQTPKTSAQALSNTVSQAQQTTRPPVNIVGTLAEPNTRPASAIGSTPQPETSRGYGTAATSSEVPSAMLRIERGRKPGTASNQLLVDNIISSSMSGDSGNGTSMMNAVQSTPATSRDPTPQNDPGSTVPPNITGPVAEDVVNGSPGGIKAKKRNFWKAFIPGRKKVTK